MPSWWARRKLGTVDARRRQVVAQAQAVLASLQAEGQPPSFIRLLGPFVDLAPEVLALGPAPASLTMRVMYGLCTFQGATLQRFQQSLRSEFASPSPTLRAVQRSGLVTFDTHGLPQCSEAGKALFERLRALGAFDETP